METKTLKKIILIRNIYIFFAIATIFSALFEIANNIIFEVNNINYLPTIESIINIILFAIAIFGIYCIKPWVIIYILFLSYGHILISLIAPRFIVDNIEFPLVIAASEVLSVLFFTYQILIFSKVEVRNYFKDNDNNII